MERKFEIHSKYKPSGDQPKAIEKIVEGINKGYDAQQNRSRVESTKLSGKGGNLYTKEVDAFVDAIINDKTPPITADDAIKAQMIVEAAYESADNGTVIRF